MTADETLLDREEAPESCALRRRFPSAELTALLPGARRTPDGPAPGAIGRGAFGRGDARHGLALGRLAGPGGRRTFALAAVLAALLASAVLVAPGVPGRWRAASGPLEAAGRQDGHDPASARSPEQGRAQAPRELDLERARAALRSRDFAAARAALARIPHSSALGVEAEELRGELSRAIDASVRAARDRVEASDPQGAAALLAPVLAADPRRPDALGIRRAMSRRRARTSGGASPSGPIERMPAAAALR